MRLRAACLSAPASRPCGPRSTPPSPRARTHHNRRELILAPRDSGEHAEPQQRPQADDRDVAIGVARSETARIAKAIAREMRATNETGARRLSNPPSRFMRRLQSARIPGPSSAAPRRVVSREVSGPARSPSRAYSASGRRECLRSKRGALKRRGRSSSRWLAWVCGDDRGTGGRAPSETTESISLCRMSFIGGCVFSGVWAGGLALRSLPSWFARCSIRR